MNLSRDHHHSFKVCNELLIYITLSISNQMVMTNVMCGNTWPFLASYFYYLTISEAIQAFITAWNSIIKKIRHQIGQMLQIEPHVHLATSTQKFLLCFDGAGAYMTNKWLSTSSNGPLLLVGTYHKCATKNSKRSYAVRSCRMCAIFWKGSYIVPRTPAMIEQWQLQVSFRQSHF